MASPSPDAASSDATTPPASVDLYRDTPVRFLGYANELGESFKPLIPRVAYFGTYGVACAYVAADAITPKNGYWVYRGGASTIITIYGAPVDNTTVAVDAGWNLVGPVAAPPYAPVPVDVQPANALESVIWIYLNGRYQSVNSLQPGFGHWLHAGEPATLND